MVQRMMQKVEMSLIECTARWKYSLQVYLMCVCVCVCVDVFFSVLVCLVQHGAAVLLSQPLESC